MEVPNIHKCLQLTSENSDLKLKLNTLKQRTRKSEAELRDIKEKLALQALLKEYVTSRDVSTQTEPSKAFMPGYNAQVRNKETKMALDKTGKLLTMHNQLMRRYESEVKANLQHTEALTDLQIKVGSLEREIREERDRVTQLEKSLKVPGVKAKMQTLSMKDQVDELAQVKKDRNKMKSENRKLRNELNGLDQGFFEEIEDIKFALQQSAKLNKEYEKALKSVCARFGVPYPHPECIINS